MVTISEDLKLAVSKLKNDQIIALPVFDSYYLVSKESSFVSGSLNSVHLFKSYKQIRDFAPNAPKYFDTLIKSFTPGNIVFTLKIDSNEVQAAVPVNSDIKEILHNFVTPLVAIKILDNQGLPIVNPYDLEVFGVEFALKSEFLLKYDAETAVLGCTQENKILIHKLGNMHQSTLQKTFNNSIEIIDESGSSSSSLKFDFPMYKIDDWIEIPGNRVVVAGTKEKLSKIFKFDGKDYFHYKTHGKYILVNLGSQTSPKVLAKNIYYNFSLINYLQPEKVIVLWQNWGKSSPAKLVDFILKKHTTDYREVDQANPQEATTFAVPGFSTSTAF